MLTKWNHFLNQVLDLNFGEETSKNKKRLTKGWSTAILFFIVIAWLLAVKILISLGTEILPGTM